MRGEPWKRFDCYKILETTQSATPGEIRRAYYAMSRRTHPDAGGSHEAQIRVNLAYEVLSDPISRQAHDLFWYDGRPASGTRSTYRTAPSSRNASWTVHGEPLGPFFARVNSRLSGEHERIRNEQAARERSNVGKYQEVYSSGLASR